MGSGVAVSGVNVAWRPVCGTRSRGMPVDGMLPDGLPVDGLDVSGEPTAAAGTVLAIGVATATSGPHPAKTQKVKENSARGQRVQRLKGLREYPTSNGSLIPSSLHGGTGGTYPVP